MNKYNIGHVFGPEPQEKAKNKDIIEEFDKKMKGFGFPNSTIKMLKNWRDDALAKQKKELINMIIKEIDELENTNEDVWTGQEVKEYLKLFLKKY